MVKQTKQMISLSGQAAGASCVGARPTGVSPGYAAAQKSAMRTRAAATRWSKALPNDLERVTYRGLYIKMINIKC